MKDVSQQLADCSSWFHNRFSEHNVYRYRWGQICSLWFAGSSHMWRCKKTFALLQFPEMKTRCYRLPMWSCVPFSQTWTVCSCQGFLDTSLTPWHCCVHSDLTPDTLWYLGLWLTWCDRGGYWLWWVSKVYRLLLQSSTLGHWTSDLYIQFWFLHAAACKAGSLISDRLKV